MSQEITIVLADDHPIVRKGLRDMIEEDPALRVVAEAPDGGAAVEAVERHRPQITVLDVDMPLMDGFNAARRIAAKKLPTEIVFLTMHRDEDIFNEAVDLGARGFVLKDSALEEIVDCIKMVAKKSHYVSPTLTSFLLNRSRRAFNLAEKKPGIKDLTPAERQVLKLIAENLTSRQIGERLFVSPRTIEKHRENIVRKLELQGGSHSLFKFAVTHKSELQ